MFTCMWLCCLRPSRGSNRNFIKKMQNYLLNLDHKYLCFQRHVFNCYCIITKLFIHDICLFWVFNKNWWTIFGHLTEVREFRSTRKIIYWIKAINMCVSRGMFSTVTALLRKLFIHDSCLFWVFNNNWWTILQCAHFFFASQLKLTKKK